MPVHAHREVAAVDQSFPQRWAKGDRQDVSTDAVVPNIERAEVAIEIGVLAGHFHKNREVLRVEQRAFRRAVRGNHRDATFQR